MFSNKNTVPVGKLFTNEKKKEAIARSIFRDSVWLKTEINNKENFDLKYKVQLFIHSCIFVAFLE